MIGLSAREVCNKVGISFSNDILKDLREQGLIKFINIGKKFRYLDDEPEKIKRKIIDGEISIKTNNKRYYITVNR